MKTLKQDKKISIHLLPFKTGKRKTEKGDCSVYVLGVYVILLVMLLGLFALQARMVNVIRDTYDSGLLLALMGVATVNVEEYGRTGQRVIHAAYTGAGDVFGAAENASCPDEHLERALEQCKRQLASNLELAGTQESGNAIVSGPVVLDEFKVFNVYKKVLGDGTVEHQVYEFTWSEAGWEAVVHAAGERVYVSGAGEKGDAVTEVSDTTLYAQISFQLNIFPYFQGMRKPSGEAQTLPVSIRRSVSVPQNER